MKPFILIPLAVAAVALALTACGESKQDKAKSQVCDSRADIQKQVNTLQSLTPATVTADGVKNSLNSIGDSLKKIADAQSDLNAERKQQVQSANDQFVSEYKSVASEVGQNLSVANARTKLQAAAQQLAAAYNSTFAKVDCS
jgi:conjugal transfer/entry exclusion protein